MADDDDLLVMSPGDERAQKVARAIGSPTAGEILRQIGEGKTTASDLAAALSLPMSTVKYHLENLLEAGILEVAGTRYSVKGREVKIYRIRDQVVIIAPPHTSVRSLLLKYASLFGITVAASLASAVILSLHQAATSPAAREWLTGAGGGVGTQLAVTATSVADNALAAPLATALPTPVPTGTLVYAGGMMKSMATATENVAEAVVPAATQALFPPPEIPAAAAPAGGGLDVVLAFFLGGCLVIGAIIIWDLFQRRRHR